MTAHQNSQIVFLPGTLCDENVFKFQRQIFPKAIMLNLRQSSSMAEMVELVNQVAAENLILIGFSMGGYVAQEAAIKFPQRVKKMVIIASSSEGYPEAEKNLVLSSLDAIKKGPFKGITDRRLRDYLHPDSYENLELKKVIQDMSGSDAKEVYLRQFQAAIERKNLMSEMEKLSCPILFIGGIDDKIITIDSVERSALNCGAELVKIPQCGHFVTLEKPQETNNALINFLS